jgi:hypothetical protein
LVYNINRAEDQRAAIILNYMALILGIIIFAGNIIISAFDIRDAHIMIFPNRSMTSPKVGIETWPVSHLKLVVSKKCKNLSLTENEVNICK